MLDVILWILRAILVVLVIPIVLVPIALLFGTLSGWSERRDWRRVRRRSWRELRAQLESGTSPVHQWVNRFPSLFDGAISLEAPKAVSSTRWQLGTVGGAPLSVSKATEASHAFVLGTDSEPHLDWQAWRTRAARQVVDSKLRAALERQLHDDRELHGLVQELNPFLLRPVGLPAEMGGDMLALYRQVARFLPCGEPLAVLGEADLERRIDDYYEHVWGEPPATRFDSSGPPPSGNWRAASRFEQADYYTSAYPDDAHWGDDEDEMNVLLYNDGPRTLEVRLHPHEGAQVIGYYETPGDFIKRAVLGRAIDELERRVASTA